jgi:hypothetical protein
MTTKKPFGWASIRGYNYPLRYLVGDTSGVIPAVIVAAQRRTA